jgi:hypothetical protein
MRANRLLKILKIMLMVLVAAVALGFIVESLWNAVVPPVFGWRLITFWQALGLLLLSKILFGGFHRHVGGGGPWKRRMKERWEHMTPEERDRFRTAMRCGRGPFATPDAPQS